MPRPADAIHLTDWSDLSQMPSMNWSVHSIVVVSVVAAAASARAEPALHGVRCAIEGPTLVLHEPGDVFDGLVATPDGRLVVMTGDGKLHIYRVRGGKTCVLVPERVIDSTVGRDFAWARLDVDAHGTLYANSGVKLMRIDGGRVSKMCGEGFVAASPSSERIWRSSTISSVWHDTSKCHGGPKVSFAADHEFMGTIWAVGDHAVARSDVGARLYDDGGRLVSALKNPRGVDGMFKRFVACGDAVCGLGADELMMWDAVGGWIGSWVISELLGSNDVWHTTGFAVVGRTGYLLGELGTNEKTVIERVDELVPAEHTGAK